MIPHLRLARKSRGAELLVKDHRLEYPLHRISDQE